MTAICACTGSEKPRAFLAFCRESCADDNLRKTDRGLACSGCASSPSHVVLIDRATMFLVPSLHFIAKAGTGRSPPLTNAWRDLSDTRLVDIHVLPMLPSGLDVQVRLSCKLV